MTHLVHGLVTVLVDRQVGDSDLDSSSNRTLEMKAASGASKNVSQKARG